MTTLKNTLIYLFLFYIAISQIAPRAFALVMKDENAIVILEGCENKTCHLKGTLSKHPITLDNVLTKEDGTIIMFSQENKAIIVRLGDTDINEINVKS